MPLFLDTSVIIDHLRGRLTTQVAELRQRLGVREMVIGDLVLMEVLQGISEPRVLRATDEALSTFTCHDLLGVRRARSAARRYRRLRAHGITPRSSIHVAIASFCVEAEIELLASDRDFQVMAPVLGLRLWLPQLS